MGPGFDLALLQFLGNLNYFNSRFFDFGSFFFLYLSFFETNSDFGDLDFNFCGSVAGIAVTNFFLIRQFFLSFAFSLPNNQNDSLLTKKNRYLHSTLFKLLFFPRELVIPLFNYSGLAWGRGGSPCSPDACLLRVSVLRATNLRNLEILTKSDPYVTGLFVFLLEIKWNLTIRDSFFVGNQPSQVNKLQGIFLFSILFC